MEFKIGDRVEALEDGFIERDNCNNVKVDILLYKKGTKGTILNVWKNDLLVKFDSGYDDCKWSIPKKHCKLINKKNEMGLENIPKIIQQHENNLKEKWNKFVNEKIIINCESKLDFEDFMNFAYKNFDLDYFEYEGAFEKYKDKLCFEYNNKYNDLHYWDINSYKTETEYKNYKIITWNKFTNNEVDNMEKTFKEVIRDIKKGEVWESEYKIIYIDVDKIRIDNKSGREFNFMIFNGMDKYTLQRKEYEFIDAKKAYKEGKEVESCVTKSRYKFYDGDCYYDKEENTWVEVAYLLIKEINGKWYIND